MSDEQGYNGWKNYETWCMALWIDNDEGSYYNSRKMAADAVASDPATSAGRNAQGVLADQLKDWMSDEMNMWEPTECSVFTDLLHAAFSEVDWYEIAENFLSELSS